MSSKGLLSICLSGLMLFFCAWGFVYGEEPQEVRQKGKEEEMVELNFPDQIDIEAFLDYVSKRTKTRFLYDPAAVQGKITIKSPTKVRVNALVAVLESVLEVSGKTLVQSGEWMKVVQVEQAKVKPLPVLTAEELELLPAQDIVVTQILPLKYVEPAVVTEVISPFLSQAANMKALTEERLLIITDYAQNIRRLLKIIEVLDVERPKAVLEVIPLKYASAEGIANTINKLLATQRRPGPRPVAVRSRQVRTGTGPPQTVLVEAGRISPMGAISRVQVDFDARTNSLLVVGYQQEIEAIRNIVEKLDVKTEERRIRFYPLENAKATDVAETLRTLLEAKMPGKTGVEGRTRAPEGAPISSRVVADEHTNAVIITASAEEHMEIEALIKELDKRRPQVIVEARLVRISSDELHKLGVELETSDFLADFGAAFVTSFGITEFDLDTGARTLGLARLGLTAAVLNNNRVPVLLHALTETTSAEVRSLPRILVNDNEEATLISQQEVPFTSIQTFPTADRITTMGGVQGAGTTLAITPSISEGDFLRLETNLEVSSFIGAPIDPSLPPPRAVDQLSTTVTIPDNSTIVIGGITSTAETETVNKVPILGDIPLLGLLFQAKEKTFVDTTLFVFISCKIYREEDFADLKEAGIRAEEELGRLKEGAGVMEEGLIE